MSVNLHCIYSLRISHLTQGADMQLKLFSRRITREVDSFEKCGCVRDMVIDISLFSSLLPLDMMDEHDVVFSVL